MKNLMLIFVSLFFLITVNTQTALAGNPDSESKGIQFFEGTWEEALALAKQENKLIFLDVYATWCGPCKRLKANTFPDPEVGYLYNSHFINVMVDGEKGEGPELRRKYGVRGYPTLLFIDHEGNVVERTSGYRNSAQFLNWGQKVVSRL
jgi:thioredoxin 1